MDMYRQRDKLLKALETLTPIMIGLGLGDAQQTGKPFIFMPLHKGVDGFLSDKQFSRFYWPSPKAVIEGLIHGGCIPLPAAEGCYNTRLKYLSELPAGKSIWMSDRTDMEKAKKVEGDTLCLLGNIPSSMLKLGSPEDVRDYPGISSILSARTEALSCATGPFLMRRCLKM
jgi:uroporphyrinogen-III decarboxylase